TLIEVFVGRPSATSRIATSRSVSVPIAFPDASQTGKNPTFRSRILHAAVRAVSVGERHTTSLIMMSSQSMLHLLETPFAERNPPATHATQGTTHDSPTALRYAAAKVGFARLGANQGGF